MSTFITQFHLNLVRDAHNITHQGKAVIEILPQRQLKFLFTAS